jgi:hypothetical protein
MEFREKPHTDKYKGKKNDSNYVANCTPTSPPLWDLEYFDSLIFVAQSVQGKMAENSQNTKCYHFADGQT